MQFGFAENKSQSICQMLHSDQYESFSTTRLTHTLAFCTRQKHIPWSLRVTNHLSNPPNLS